MLFTQAATHEFTKNEVCLALTCGGFGHHIGILFRSAEDQVFLMHLNWHHRLDVEVFPDKGCWVAATLALPTSASKQAVGFVRAVSRRKAQIPYGIGLRTMRGSFDSKGSYKTPKGNDGLTCATFVNEVFRGASLPLVDEAAWKDLPENLAWGIAVCRALEATNVDPSHVAKVKANISGLRVRPEEVAASATVGALDRPINFDVAQKPALELRQLLTEACPKLLPTS